VHPKDDLYTFMAPGTAAGYEAARANAVATLATW